MKPPRQQVARRADRTRALRAGKEIRPTWGELQRATKIESRANFVQVLQSPETKGFFDIIDGSPRSARITAAGVQAALNGAT